jgi:hypothetical protein
MSTFAQRLGRGFTRLKYFLPAWGLCALASFIDHPAVLVVLLAAQPLFLAGAVSALGYVLDTDFRTLTLRRGLVMLAMVLAYALFVALVLGTPTLRLAREASLLNAVLLSSGFVLSVLALWRFWPAPGLAFVWDDAYPERDEGSWIVVALRRCLAFSVHLSRERDPYFGRGLPVAVGLLLTIAGAMTLAGLCGTLPSELRVATLWLYALLLCPATYLGLSYRVEHLLFDSASAPHASEPQAEVGAEPVSASGMIAAVDPVERNAQLRAAAAANQIDLALNLLRQGASADAQPQTHDRDQRSLVLIAATCPDLRLLREAIARGADLNRAVSGLTPLLAATRDSYQGRPDAVMTLLTNGADTRAADAEGNTPLHYSALSREATVAAMLLDAGADLGAMNREGLTALGMACAAGNELLVRYLLEHKAKPDVARAVPALIAACGGTDDLPGLIKLLIKHGAAADARDTLGRTALHTAALHGHAEMAEALIAAGAPIDAADQHGVTALMEAARAGSNRVLQRLMFRKPAVASLDQAGRDALIIACQSRRANEDTVRMLLTLGARTDTQARDGKRAMDHAVVAGRWRIAALIDPQFALPDAVRPEHEDDSGEHGPNRRALLLSALRQSRWLVAQELAQLEPHPSTTEWAELFVELAVDTRVLAQDAALNWVVRHGFVGEMCLTSGQTLLAELARTQPAPLLALRAALDGTQACGGGALSDLLAGAAEIDPAARTDFERVALDVLERGADPFARGAAHESCLQRAVAARLPALALALIARGVDPNAADMRGRTALHELASLPEDLALPLAHALLRAGSDPERAASDGQTPLGAALAAGRAQLSAWLSWTHGLRHPARALRADDVPTAAACGDRIALERLLTLGFPLDARDAQGCTALLRASGGGHAEIVSLLLARGADATLSAHTGASCLSAAVSARREACVRLLLEHGVPADQPLPGGSTPLMVAAALGLTTIARVLLDRGADAKAVDQHGGGVLHAAAQFAFHHGDPDRARELLSLLVERGAPVDQTNQAGQTPLLLLLGARAEPGTPSPQRKLAELMQWLLAQGADPNAQDQRGVSCLHAAAMHGLLHVCGTLMRAGADPKARDRLGRDAHEVALMLGYADVAGELRRASLVANMRRS